MLLILTLGQHWPIANEVAYYILITLVSDRFNVPVLGFTVNLSEVNLSNRNLESSNRTNTFTIQTFTDNWHQSVHLQGFVNSLLWHRKEIDARDTMTKLRRLALQIVHL